MLRRIASWALVLATLGFVAVTIARHRAELAAAEWNIHVPLLLASIAVLLVALGYGIWIWRRILAHLGTRLSFPAALRIWFLASLARYVPGKVWQFVGAAQLGREHGVAALPIVTSMLLSMGFTLAAAGAVGLPFLVLRLAADSGLATALGALGLVASIVVVHPRVLNAALAAIPRRLHRDVLSWGASWRDGLQLLAGSIVTWIIYGIGFTLFAAAVFPIGMEAVGAFVAANAIAMLAGALAVVAPAGLGAREVTLTVLLEPYLATGGAAALLAILSRLWIIVGELTGAALSIGLERRARRTAGL